MSGARPTITLLTDFGLQDPYVGIMKGVILGICPGARLIDLTHQVDPQDIMGGALCLAQSVEWFPEGTIHLAVVDPGVGSARRGVVVATERHLYVGPDNGLLSLALERDPPQQAYVIERYTLPVQSSTFHGRDVFAPVAAHLARGILPDEVGPEAGKLSRLDIRSTRQDKSGAQVAAVLRVDRFGNLITGAHRAALGFPLREVEFKGRRLRLCETYSQVHAGEPLALWGSDGFLELAVNCGSAARLFEAGRGDRVRLL